MNAFGRSLAYRLWVVLGLLAVVTVVVVLSAREPPGSDRPLKAGVVAVVLYVAGILVLASIQLGRDGRAAAAAAGATGIEHAGPPREEELHAALALEADPQAARTVRETTRFNTRHFAYLSLVTVGFLAGATAYLFGVDATVSPLGEDSITIPVTVLPALALTFAGGLALPRTMKRGFALAGAHHTGGLGFSASPRMLLLPTGDGGLRPHLRGATVLAGTRHGREVEIVVDVRNSVVQVAAPAAAFRVNGTRDRLWAEDGAPAAVIDVLERVGEDRRWRDLAVEGGPGGITVARAHRRQAEEDHLLDLWLCERLLDALDSARR